MGSTLTLDHACTFSMHTWVPDPAPMHVLTKLLKKSTHYPGLFRHRATTAPSSIRIEVIDSFSETYTRIWLSRFATRLCTSPMQVLSSIPTTLLSGSFTNPTVACRTIIDNSLQTSSERRTMRKMALAVTIKKLFGRDRRPSELPA